MLKIKKLKKYYKKIKGVENINLDIKKSEIFGFVGPNGSGKSTTIKCIMNLINKNSGEIFVDDILDTKNEVSLKESIGYLPSEIHLYDDLTVKGMINYSLSFYKINHKENANRLVKRLKLDLNKKVEDLSLGNQKKLGIILALMHEPKLLILDEPTSGLDPLMQEEFYEILLEEKEKGTTIFFSSHILSEIRKICDRVAIIKEGKIVEVKDVDEITNTNFYNVTIKSKDINKIKKELNIKNKDEILKFIYKENINDLLKLCSKYDVEKLLIEEPTIEEIFMHFYK